MALAEISQAGVSIWLDDLSRERMKVDGTASYLPELISQKNVVGVTTNPAIFASAIANSELYRSDILQMQKSGLATESIITELTCSDVKQACEIFHDTYLRSGGKDGRVSIEVDPRLARDTKNTIEQAQFLWQKIDMPNLLIKVPATKEGLPAIAKLISEGISVNVTIIFSVSRYREVLAAYQAGLTERRANGLSISGIHSVASFFVSRVDTEIDPQLRELGRSELCGRAAIANARLAYQEFVEVSKTPSWSELAAAGAALQRPLWASTGVKDPNYDPAMYVTELIAPDSVNTMPESTLVAASQTKNFRGDTITGNYEDASEVITELSNLGIDIEQVAEKLELEGIEKFIKPWLELISTVSKVTP